MKREGSAGGRGGCPEGRRVRQRASASPTLVSGAVAIAGLAGCAAPFEAGEGEEPAPLEVGAELAFPGSFGEPAEGIVLVDGRPVSLGFARHGGEAVLEGDILLDPGLLPEAHEASLEREGRTGEAPQPLAARRDRRWPGGVVPFVVDPDLPGTDRVEAAIAHYHDFTHVRFRPRVAERDFVRFAPGDGCASGIGRAGGEQFVRLAPSCSVGSVIHELGHTLGLWHEHARADRHLFVLVFPDNALPGFRHNFSTYLQQDRPGEDIGPYDFGSIMHYGSYAFSRRGRPTLLRRRDRAPFSAQRAGLSASDVLGLERLYPRPPPLACVVKRCEEVGRACGPAGDGCGGLLSCGGCARGEICDDGVCTPGTCEPLTCDELGFRCGEASDGCGGAIQCGGCGRLERCVDHACRLVAP